MVKDPAKLCCPKENCSSANPLTEKFCLVCGAYLTKRYLWAVGNDPILNDIGTVLGDRYLVVGSSILLDTKPNLLPQIPDIEETQSIKPYLKLISHRLHTPQLYGTLTLAGKPKDKEILLIEKPPIKLQPITDPENIQVALCDKLPDIWNQASSIRQIHWLWQIANLWEPLITERAGSSLLDPELLRVEGQLIRLRELHLDEQNLPSLVELGKFFQKLASSAKPSIISCIQSISDALIQRKIISSEQLVQVLDRALVKLERNQQTEITVCTKTDQGPNRQRNEDACYPPSQTLVSKSPTDKTLAIVCDGIGGHEGGNVASNLAIDSITQKVPDVSSLSFENNPSQLLSNLEQYIAYANDIISQKNDDQHKQGRQRMGTTIVMALPIAHEMYITHIGDSRAYWITKYNCHQVTLDDDVACREVRLGYALYREALQHSGSGSLVQALGMSKSSSLHPTSQRFIIDEDAVFLLTSDGLSDFDRVEEYWESEILPLLNDKTNIENVVNKLIEIANSKNGHDNATVALVHYQVRYSEPENIIEADISNLTPAPTLNLTAPDVNGASAKRLDKPGIFGSQRLNWIIAILPFIGCIIILLLLLIDKSSNKNNSNNPNNNTNTTATSSESPGTNATNKPPVPETRTLDNLQKGWVIETKKPTTINKKTYTEKTFFKVKVIDENPKKKVKVTLEICKPGLKPEETSISISNSELKKLKDNKEITVIQSNQPNDCDNKSSN
ncbi:protein phosphatase 2C domain-containing protein [Anabaena sp. FACHB-1237]|uniref:PP2C family protein-serine/threonine phosphatase n=1 Tax=Anabaena sp. FACHB-1237 TaxID=2692769 RepID=UPI001680698F|nr:protein phosphatase 2C domain-containing protein [Anabaena sp. FACHB-1237]MBD2138537.1 protein phosphatase 2C domain-containing protein [Anabaena sp. FACHB-1237]